MRSDFTLEHATFEPAVTEHGTFTLHAYPYANDKSTFLVETDEQTWRNAGFDVTTELTPDHESDHVALDQLSQVFSGTLGGRPLVGNRSRWTRFRSVTCQRWFHGNVVLVGDAPHTAHSSIGSGTRLWRTPSHWSTRCTGARCSPGRTYELQRRPVVESLQQAARRSAAGGTCSPTASTCRSTPCSCPT